MSDLSTVRSGTDNSHESSSTWNLRSSTLNRAVSRRLRISAQRAVSRGRDLCQVAHERRWRPDFFYHLAEYAQTIPRIRRFLPVGGGATDYRLQVETDEHGGVYVLRLSGEVDLATVGVLQDALGQVQNSRRVILDCQKLTYMDSTGLNLLVRLRERGFRFAMVSPPAGLQKIVRVIGLTALIPLTRTCEEALRVLTGTRRPATNE